MVRTGERGFQVDSSLYIGRKRNSLAIDQANRIQPIRTLQVVEERTHVVVHSTSILLINLFRSYSQQLLLALKIMKKANIVHAGTARHGRGV